MKSIGIILFLLLCSYNCQFPDIERIYVTKLNNKDIEVYTKLDVEIKCDCDVAKLDKKYKVFNCRSEELFVLVNHQNYIFKIPYRINEKNVLIQKDLDGFRTIVYSKTGKMIKSEITKEIKDGLKLSSSYYNQSVMVCVIPYSPIEIFYQYTCWIMTVNRPIRAIWRELESYKPILNLNIQIFWELEEDITPKSHSYMVQIRNMKTDDCCEIGVFVNSKMQPEKSSCKLIETKYWTQLEILTLPKLNPISKYEITVWPVIESKTYAATKIQLRSPYGTNEDSCFADCLHRSSDGTFEYGGIRLLTDQKNECYQNCQFKYAINPYMCYFQNFDSQCNIPMCEDDILAGDSCVQVSSHNLPRSIKLNWFDKDSKQSLLGYIILVHQVEKCIEAAIFTETPKLLKSSVNNFYTNCENKLFVPKIDYEYKIKNLSSEETYITYIIPIVTHGRIGFIKRDEHIIEPFKNLDKKKREVYPPATDRVTDPPVPDPPATDPPVPATDPRVTTTATDPRVTTTDPRVTTTDPPTSDPRVTNSVTSNPVILFLMIVIPIIILCTATIFLFRFWKKRNSSAPGNNNESASDRTKK